MVNFEKILKENFQLNHKKSSQDSEVPAYIVNVNSRLLRSSFGGLIKSSKLSLGFRLVDIISIHEK